MNERLVYIDFVYASTFPHQVMLKVNQHKLYAAIIIISLMQNPEVFSHHRNKTLPLKTNMQIRSLNKIKISMKGLPKDFFNHEGQQNFIKSNKMRCKTQAFDNEFEETSYFQQSETLSPKKIGRWYKSQQRKHALIDTQQTKKDERSGLGHKDIMEYTFNLSLALQNKEKRRFGGCMDSGRASRNTNKKMLGIQWTEPDMQSGQSDINSIFKPRQCINISRIRSGLHRGLPLIRLCKPKVR